MLFDPVRDQLRSAAVRRSARAVTRVEATPFVGAVGSNGGTARNTATSHGLTQEAIVSKSDARLWHALAALQNTKREDRLQSNINDRTEGREMTC